MKRVYYFITIGAIVFFLLIVLLFKFPLNLAWRAELLSKKVKGHLPNATWQEIGRLLPPRFIIPKELSKDLTIEVNKRGNEPCPILWQTMLGSFWGRETDREALNLVVLEQIFNIYMQGPVHIKQGDTVFDIGAHLGVFTRVALDCGASKVVMFEPEPTNIACLEKTFKKEILNGQVLLIKAAAWNEKGILCFGGGGLTFRYKGSKNKIGATEVFATTIDTIAEELDINRVDFIKMDIEGSERYALQGAENVLKTYSPRLAIASYHHHTDPPVLSNIIIKTNSSYRKYTSPYSYYHRFLYFY